MSENISSDICAQQRFRSAVTFQQSGQNLHWHIVVRAVPEFTVSPRWAAPHFFFFFFFFFFLWVPGGSFILIL